MDNNHTRNIGKLIKQSDIRAQRLYETDAVSRLKKYSTAVDYTHYIVQELSSVSKIQFITYFPVSEIELFALVIGPNLLSKNPSIYEITRYREQEKKIVQDISRKIRSERAEGWILTSQEVDTEVQKKIEQLRTVLQGIPEFVSLREENLFCAFLPPSDIVATDLAPYSTELEGLFVIILEGSLPDSKWVIETYGVLSAKSRQYVEQLEAAIKEDPAIQSIKRRGFKDRLIAETSLQRRIEKDDKRQSQIDDAIGTMGRSVFLLLHRFVNLQRPAEAIARHFSTPEEVAAQPELFMANMEQLKNVLEKTRRFERIISRAKVSGVFSRTPEFQIRSLSSVIRIIHEYTVHQGLVCEDQIDASLLPIELRWHPFYEEAIQVVLDNCYRAFEESNEKKIHIDARNEGDRIAIHLINFGAGIPNSMLKDIKLHRPVSGTSGTGLGLYFTWTLLQYIGGDIDVDNLPGNQGVKTVFHMPISLSGI